MNEDQDAGESMKSPEKEPIQTEWVVITGGPSSGKTSVINRLKELGYKTVPEAAEELIEEERAKGKKTEDIRVSEEEFTKLVFYKKLEKETRLSAGSLTFLDRGLPDTIAYGQADKYDISYALNDPRLNVNKYKKVFLLDLVPFEQTEIRIEDKAFAERVDQELSDAYKSLGYDVVRVPALPGATLKEKVDTRTQFLLQSLQLTS